MMRRKALKRLLHMGTVASLALGLTAGCTPPPVGLDDSDLDGDIHPRTMFDKRVEPQLVNSCSACHATAQGSVQAFLTEGMEYDSIIAYKSGVFLTTPAVQSLLLQKGQHTGPAFSEEQFAAVQSWLEAEAATRATGGMKSGLLPTVPLEPGDYNMSFGELDPIRDPGANLTFTLTEGADRIFRISSLKLVAGPMTGIRFKHPIFYFISSKGSFADPADSLKAVDLEVDASKTKTVGPGAVLLTQAPTNRLARVGVAFELLEKHNEVPPMEVKCKAFNLFNPAVKDQLQSCAQTCHAPGRNNVANSAFNMAASMSSDNAALQAFCLATLGRVFKEKPQDSILIKQITPQAQGGTPNHPFKQTDGGALQRFSNAVTAWAAGEK